ncbi:hypothetical protein IQ07DRAFT_606452 [Pyrenochaeta sp. DS3sAY3a]|nr:hypothetical protein IQ07DRAFT_606452 [Pyrenochaeta sp. DS3sAY3a]
MQASQPPKSGVSTVVDDTMRQDNASDTSTVQKGDSESTMRPWPAIAEPAKPKSKAPTILSYGRMFRHPMGMKRAKSPIEDDSEDEHRREPNHTIFPVEFVSDMCERLSEVEQGLSQAKERILILENEKMEFLDAIAQFRDQHKRKAGFGTFQQTERISGAADRRTTAI